MRHAAASLLHRRPTLSGAVAAKTNRTSAADALPQNLPVMKEGWLSKRGGSHGGRTNWKRRWFMLMGDTLYYMDSHSDRTPRGRVALSGCDFRNCEEELRKSHSFGIYHMTNMSVVPFFCAADSADSAVDWLNALQQAAQGRFNYSEEHEEASLALGLISQLLREHEPRRMPQAQLQVTVVEARGLAPMDRNGLSDPYCVLHCGAVRSSTRVIQKTLNPRWEEAFLFEVAQGASMQLQLDCFDRDLLSSDDFLGTLKIPVDELLAEDDGEVITPRGSNP